MSMRQIPVSINPHALVATIMLVSKNMETLEFTPNYFHYFEGNVDNMAVTRKIPHARGLTCSSCFLYNVVLENYSVQNSPGGGGEEFRSRLKVHFDQIIILSLCIRTLRREKTFWSQVRVYTVCTLPAVETRTYKVKKTLKF